MKHTNHDFSYYCNFLQWREHNTARSCQFQKCDHWLVNFISAISNVHVKILTCLFQRVFSTKSWAFAQCLLLLRGWLNEGNWFTFGLPELSFYGDRQIAIAIDHPKWLYVSTIDCLCYSFLHLFDFIIYLIFI